MRTKALHLGKAASWLLGGVLALGAVAVVSGCDDHHYRGRIHYDSYHYDVVPYRVYVQRLRSRIN